MMLKKILPALLCTALFSAPAFSAINLKFSIVQGTQSNDYKAIKAMADYVQEKTDGEVKVRIYTDAQLGDDQETLEQMTAGTIDMGLATISRYGTWKPEMAYLGYPYSFENFDHVQAFVESTYFKKTAESMRNEYNWRILSLAYGGARQTTTTVKPINSVDDMKGLKIRVPTAKGNMLFASGVGASPSPMSFTEVYLALKTNAVDGQENPLSIIDGSKLYEVQKHLTLTNHMIVGVNFLISDLTWKRIPEKYHAAINEGAQLGAKVFSELYQQDEKNLISKFEKEGVTISAPDLDPFIAKFEPIRAEYKKEFGQKATDILVAINETKP